MMDYLLEFVKSEETKNILRDIILRVGQETVEAGNEYSSRLNIRLTYTDLLQAAKIIENRGGRFKLTVERGRELYELFKLEE